MKITPPEANPNEPAEFERQKLSVPAHVAVIMDGNGRWANKRGLPRVAGHRKGVDMVRELVKDCADKQIQYLTVFAFSSENWRRPAVEVRLLMDLLKSVLENEVRKLHKNNVRLRILGDLSVFPMRIRSMIFEAQRLTENNTRLNLNVAVNYGGKWDITQAARQLAQRVADGLIKAQDIDAQMLESCLTTAGMPEPDLFIRTGGEQRISNFLIWQLAYTELFFTDTLWPDFDRQEFEKSLLSFQNRQRRFGQTGDQVATLHPARSA